MTHFRLPQHTAIDLRLYHRERKGQMRADKRLQVLKSLSPQLNEEVTWEVNKRWLIRIPCFMCVI